MQKSNSAYQFIRRSIENASVVGGDETGCKIDGALHWMWTFQNELCTYIFSNQSRGKVAIDKHFPNGFPNSILVTDRHSSYFNVEAYGHQVCLAHLPGNLTFLDEFDANQNWTERMLALLRDSIHKRKSIPIEQINAQKFKDRFDVLMQENLEHLNDKFRSLQKSLIKHKDRLFTFLENPAVPSDNNASERSIRQIKVKQKVSGMFKSDDGGDNFATLYSIVHTAKKNNQNPFEALVAVAKYG